jgi:hypothetical protein
MSDEFTLLENRLRQPFLEAVRKYGKQKFTLWAIWTYMLWRSTNGVFCLPEELVLEDWGMDVYALRRARAILMEEGWLRKVTVQVPTCLVLDNSGRIRQAMVDECENWATNCRRC